MKSFNGRMRDELLNETLFFTTGQARSILARSVDDYNTERPHSSLGYATPAASAAGLEQQRAGFTPPVASPALLRDNSAQSLVTVECKTGVTSDEMKVLWSANDQMLKVLKKISAKASDPKLKETLTALHEGITKHTDVLKELIAGQDEKVSKEHCNGMEGLAAEATKHVLEEGPKKGSLLDVLIIAQYQRMTHYGIAGFGTAAAYAKALGLKNDAKKLAEATKEIYGGDEYMTQLAETSVNLHAEKA